MHPLSSSLCKKNSPKAKVFKLMVWKLPPTPSFFHAVKQFYTPGNHHYNKTSQHPYCFKKRGRPGALLKQLCLISSKSIARPFLNHRCNSHALCYNSSQGGRAAGSRAAQKTALSDQTTVRGLQHGERHVITHHLVRAEGYNPVLLQCVPQINPNSHVLGEAGNRTSQQHPPPPPPVHTPSSSVATTISRNFSKCSTAEV